MRRSASPPLDENLAVVAVLIVRLRHLIEDDDTLAILPDPPAQTVLGQSSGGLERQSGRQQEDCPRDHRRCPCRH
ncbi:hypothetical protein [Bosea sp. Tri-44]|uniref:hypothetical protein n=1 Tax=Bosea sp. Tri-44 TaxID=1972137 RepID=UPI00100FFFBD|nr:hypothetical protein [Bosea sp. Tri-44]